MYILLYWKFLINDSHDFLFQEFLSYVRENIGLTRPEDDLYQVAELVPGALLCEV